MTDEHARSWYVKASFGAEWGPMTAATLLEMSERGSLGPGDLARCGDDGDWRDVSDVLNEVTDASGTIASVFEEGDDHSDEPCDSVEEESITLAESPVVVSTSPRRSGALPGWSNFWAGSAEDQPTESVPRLTGIASWSQTTSETSSDAPSEAAETNEVVALESVTVEAPVVSPPVALSMNDGAIKGTLAVESPSLSDFAPQGADIELLNRWKQERADELNRLKAIVAEREAVLARAASVAQAAAQTSDAEATPSEVVNEPSAESIGPSPAKSESEPSVPSVRPTRATRQEPWEQTLARWKRSLPDWRLAAVLICLPIAVWWLWPTSYGDVAATYHSMYDKLREIRDRPQDKSGMTEFVERSQATLDKLIPRLKEHASSDDPETQLLLWIGRDCLRPMLKNPRQRNTKHEAMLKKLLAQWDQTHHVVATAEPVESAPPKSDDSELPPPPAGSKPLGFGRAPEPAEAASQEVTPSPKAESPRKDGQESN